MAVKQHVLITNIQDSNRSMKPGVETVSNPFLSLKYKPAIVASNDECANELRICLR